MKAAAVPAILVLGVVYCGAGILFGTLAGQAGSHQWVVAWRWTAWVVSAIAFAAHIINEQVRLRNSPSITAIHVSSAAGLGAFGLAVAANIHALATSPAQYPLILVWSLAIWPAITVLPAFVVALLAAMLFARLRRNI